MDLFVWTVNLHHQFCQPFELMNFTLAFKTNIVARSGNTHSWNTKVSKAVELKC